MSWSSTSKCCLTCAYWSGERRVGAFKRWESPSNTTNGECRCGYRINPNATYNACPRYVEMPSK